MTNAVEFIAFANTLADAARTVLCPHYRQPLPIEAKGDASPVTRADREVESALRMLIAQTYPEHGIYGEEYGREREHARYTWVIDPIDGTSSFMIGRPTFGVLIALADAGEPILGVIDQPITRERWLGCAGQPSTLNGNILTTRKIGALQHAILSTTSPYLFDAPGLKAFDAVRTASRYTVLGADCYAYGLLATGHVDVVVEQGLKPYDYAALVPVIKGAGGMITDWQGYPLTIDSAGDVLACGDAAVHRETMKLLETTG